MGENQNRRGNAPRATRRRKAGLIAIAFATVAASIAIVVSTATSANATCADCVGPGTTADMPGFIGYLTGGNEELGIAKVTMNSTAQAESGLSGPTAYGLCTDTGAAYPWPDPVTGGALVYDADVAYVMDQYIPMIRNLAASSDTTSQNQAARYAAALWWAVGMNLGADDQGLNSQKAAMQVRINTMQSESPVFFNDVLNKKNAIIADAHAHLGTYSVPLTINPTGPTTAQVANIGALSNTGNRWYGTATDTLGNTYGGAVHTLTLTNATFDATGTNTITVNPAMDAPDTEGITVTDTKQSVTVDDNVTGLPNRSFFNAWGGGSTQHVPLHTQEVTTSGKASLGPLYVYPKIPLEVVKSAAHNDPGGIIGVTVDIHQGDQTGPIVASHTFTAQDINPATSEGDYWFAGIFDSNTTYTAVISNEPAGWESTTTVLPAGLNTNDPTTATQFSATFADNKIIQPTLVTQISDLTVKPGDSIHDTVTVSGDSTNATIHAHWSLLGPVTPTAPGSCPGLADPAWKAAAVAAKGDFAPNKDGDYVVGNYTLPDDASALGCYTYIETVDADNSTSDHIRPVNAVFGDLAETTIAQASPTFVTNVSAQTVAPGATIHDTVTVTDAYGTKTTGHYRLLGPVMPSNGACPIAGDGKWNTAPVAAKGDFAVAGDGDYQVGDYTIPATGAGAVGCYTYVESADAATGVTAVLESLPGDNAETSVSRSTPVIATQASHNRAKIGTTITDTVHLTASAGQVIPAEWRLLGPISPTASGACPGVGHTAWSKARTAAGGMATFDKGDGDYKVGSFTITKDGCYTYQERLASTDGSVALAWHPVGESTESIVARTPVKQPHRPKHPYVPAGGTGLGGPVPLFGTVANAGLAGLAALAVGLLTGVAYRRRKQA